MLNNEKSKYFNIIFMFELNIHMKRFIIFMKNIILKFDIIFN